MTDYQFETHEPVALYVEIGGGDIDVTATDTTESTVHLTGRHADDVEVSLDGRTLSIVAPRRRTGFFSDDGINVTVVVPTGSDLAARSGSADLGVVGEIGSAHVKTGSGDVRVIEADTDVALTTGSGDLQIETARRGKFSAKGASGSIHVGIPAGTPVWTDISTVSGRIHSDVEGAGEPAEGADHVELRATTVSGDVILTQR